MDHVHRCRACSPDMFPPKDGPRIDEHHVFFESKRSWDDRLSEVYINGEQEMGCFQAYDGEESWALRLSPPDDARTNKSGVFQPHRCTCYSSRPCMEMVYGGVTIKRPTPEQIAEAERAWALATS